MVLIDRRALAPDTVQVSSVLRAADEITACTDVNGLARLAVELARERLGLERVGLYLHDPAHPVFTLRGTWGTGATGEMTDESSLSHELSPSDQAALLDLRSAGRFGMYRERAPLMASDGGRTSVIGEGWIMATPLVVAGKIVGVMYNDSAFTHTPVDEQKQAAASLFCALLALVLASKREAVPSPPLPRKPGQSPLVQHVLRAIHRQTWKTGDRLARQLGVSPGYLARSFKREMSMSLVEYRNRVRMDRFFEAMHEKRDGKRLVDLAVEAGFGSYAQFHRVYRKLHGRAPRNLLPCAIGQQQEQDGASSSAPAGEHRGASRALRVEAPVEPAPSADGTITPARLNDVSNYIGSSQWLVDEQFRGVYDEFRSYGTAPTRAQLMASGPRWSRGATEAPPVGATASIGTPTLGSGRDEMLPSEDKAWER